MKIIKCIEAFMYIILLMDTPWFMESHFALVIKKYLHSKYFF